MTSAFRPIALASRSADIITGPAPLRTGAVHGSQSANLKRLAQSATTSCSAAYSVRSSAVPQSSHARRNGAYTRPQPQHTNRIRASAVGIRQVEIEVDRWLAPVWPNEPYGQPVISR